MGVTRIKIEQVIKRHAIVKMTCDLCGREQKNSLLLENECDLENEFELVRWTAGYGSRFDMTTFEVVMCDECMALLSNDTGERRDLQDTVRKVHDQKREVETC